MANHMKEVAKILGVKLNEEFEVDYGNGNTAIAKITQTGLHVINTNMCFYGDINRVTLDWLLGGVCDIKRQPWKPKCRYETYFYVYSDGEVGEGSWVNAECNYMHYKLGNCYRTKKEAEADREKWINFYSSNEQINI